MFITNIAEFNNKYFYICDKQKSDELIKNGFCLLGIEDDGYYYLTLLNAHDANLIEYITLSKLMNVL